VLNRLTIILCASFGLFGCEPRHPDILLSAGHPANPYARSGRPLPTPSALRPELRRATPQLEPASPSSTRSGSTRSGPVTGDHSGHKM